MSQKTLVFIVGPTAVGKTEVGLRLAKRIDGQIISCDAMQVYREVHIASAKPTKDQLKEVQHHCIDLVSVTEDFNVGQFREHALDAIEKVQKEGQTPIILGGSGMYMTVLLDGIFEEGSRNEVLRDQLQKEAIVKGIGSLHQKLADIDPEAAGKIHRNDAKRIIRALEVCMTAGMPISQMQTQRQGLWGQMPIKIFALNRPRDILYKRVEQRVDEMFTQGLTEEIQNISQLPLSVTARTLIGIREVGGYLAGDYDVIHAKNLMKQHTRNFVKRQMTWFRRDKRIEWIDMGESVEEVVEKIEKAI